MKPNLFKAHHGISNGLIQIGYSRTVHYSKLVLGSFSDLKRKTIRRYGLIGILANKLTLGANDAYMLYHLKKNGLSEFKC